MVLITSSIVNFFVVVFFAMCFKLVKSVLESKPGGDRVVNEYNRTKALTDETRRKLVKILTADMIETHG